MRVAVRPVGLICCVLRPDLRPFRVRRSLGRSQRQELRMPGIRKRRPPPRRVTPSQSHSRSDLPTATAWANGKRKLGYRCPSCTARAWGRAGLHLICADCGHSMDPGECSARDKDRLEFEMSRLVCAGQMTLADRQREIADDWEASYSERTDANAIRKEGL
jgi:hypothetical protein